MKLKEDSKRFIEKAVNKGYVEYAGDELDRIIPPTSRRQGAREKKKDSVLEKNKKNCGSFCQNLNVLPHFVKEKKCRISFQEQSF